MSEEKEKKGMSAEEIHEFLSVVCYFGHLACRFPKDVFVGFMNSLVLDYCDTWGESKTELISQMQASLGMSGVREEEE